MRSSTALIVTCFDRVHYKNWGKLLVSAAMEKVLRALQLESSPTNIHGHLPEYSVFFSQSSMSMFGNPHNTSSNS